jgi:AraC-like DNA-binding protein
MDKAATTRALYLVKLVNQLKDRGHNPGVLLRDAGLSPGALAQRDAGISVERYISAVEAAIRRYDMPDLGFQVGERTRLTEHGVMGYALLSARTLGGSLRRYERYQYLQGPLLAIELGEENDLAWLAARPLMHGAALPDSVLRYAVQEWLIGWNQWSSLVGHSGPFFERIDIGFADAGASEMYERRLGCVVEFNAKNTRAYFPRARLDAPLNYSDAGVAAMCAEQCEHILEHLGHGHGLAAEVHRLLASVPGQVPRMDALAAHFHIDERTLRRRLLKEGTCYRDVLTEFRLALARRYLSETRLPAIEIAALIGYSDSANLFRIFRRAFGMSPQQFRDQLGEAAEPVTSSSKASVGPALQPPSTLSD